MAAPTLQAQGTIVANTNGNDLVVTIPANQVNDIIILNFLVWAPNSTNTSTLGWESEILTSGWYGFTFPIQGVGTSIFEGAGAPYDGIHTIWWHRATASTGTSVTITRDTIFDTGTDTVAAARAYVIRGCDPNGSPFDYVPTFSALSTAANPQLPAVSVGDTERLIVHFMSKTDNTTLPTAATGYTVGTVQTTTTGTDAGFQTYRRTADAAVTAVTPTGGAAPATGNGSSTYFSVAFRPNNPRRVLIT